MHPAATDKRCRSMTVRAIQVSGKMVDRLTGCATSMTAGPCAVVSDTRVVKSCRNKATGGMTDVTILVSDDVINGINFAGCENTIMTGLAVIHDTRMVKRGR